MSTNVFTCPCVIFSLFCLLSVFGMCGHYTTPYQTILYHITMWCIKVRNETKKKKSKREKTVRLPSVGHHFNNNNNGNNNSQLCCQKLIWVFFFIYLFIHVFFNLRTICTQLHRCRSAQLQKRKPEILFFQLRIILTNRCSRNMQLITFDILSFPNNPQ